MDILDDVIVYITRFLNDKEKIMFLSTSNILHQMKKNIHYEKCSDICLIRNLSYYDMFTHVMIKNTDIKLPNSITKITFHLNFNGNINEKYISNNVTHLILPHNYKHSINDCIPNSVTHLRLGIYSKDHVSNSVTHLTFCDGFNENIENCIPKSVTHLTFGYFFNKDIKKCIPDSVTHLTFGYSFNCDITDCIPSSVIELKLSKRYTKKILVHDTCNVIYY